MNLENVPLNELAKIIAGESDKKQFTVVVETIKGNKFNYNVYAKEIDSIGGYDYKAELSDGEILELIGDELFYNDFKNCTGRVSSYPVVLTDAEIKSHFKI